MTKSVLIGKHVIGQDNQIYLIAEVGTTCLGDINQAFALIEAGADSGMDAIKFQLIDPDQESDKSATYMVRTPAYTKNINRSEMFRKLQFSREEWKSIIDKCHSHNVDFFVTVDYVKGVDMLEEYAVPAHKIGAWDTTYKPLIQRIGQTGKPMFIDLGPTTEEELHTLVRWYIDAGGSAIIFLHDFHTNNDMEMNMDAIRYLQDISEWPVGYTSPARDHDLDFLALGMGAKALEKRLIMDRNVDAFHAHESLEPDELKAWVKRIRHAEHAIGRRGILPSTTDRTGRDKYYRSICTLRAIKKGDVFTPDNLHGKRPGTGLPTDYLDKVWGKRAARDLAADILINEADIQ